MKMEIVKGKLVRYEGEDRVVEIPAEVTEIGERAFNNCRFLEKLIIPDSVRTIRQEAFRMCTGLAAAEGGANVVRIERDAFTSTPWYKRDMGDELLIMGKVLVSAGKGIRHAHIPEETVMIGADAFAECTLMESVEIPPAVEYIGWRAFRECMCLKDLRIPGTVKRIGWHAFEKCNRLKNLILEEGIETLENGVFSSCRSLQKAVIPESVRSFGGWMFFSCVNLTEVRFMGPVEELPERCFSSCFQLQHVYMNKGLKRIGVEAFYECTVLQEVILPEGLKEIGRLAFGRDRFFTRLVLPSSLEKLGESVFHGCAGFEELKIPAFLEVLPENSFKGCTGIRKLTIEEGVRALSDGGFAGCRNINDLDMPDSMEEVGGRCFEGCSGLERVNLSRNLARLGAYAFAGCGRLEDINLRNIEEIGEGCFDRCIGLADDDNNIIRDGVFFFHVGNCREMSLPAEVEAVASGAFAGRRDFVKITVPESVTSVGGGAFRRCDRLEEIRILSTEVNELGERPFDGCRNLIRATVCGMRPEDFSEEDERTAAALGFCCEYGRFDGGMREAYEEYIRSRREEIALKAIDRGLTAAVGYLVHEGNLGREEYNRILEHAQQVKAMEILPVLLEYRSPEEDVNIFDRYSI
ncbi:MAG: leucine-rich repeat domain-containing protein [Firmicutes bacterium]|nr:leucine-rich repeat domain-containing protein [Bacillota bacterium]